MNQPFGQQQQYSQYQQDPFGGGFPQGSAFPQQSQQYVPPTAVKRETKKGTKGTRGQCWSQSKLSKHLEKHNYMVLNNKGATTSSTSKLSSIWTFWAKQANINKPKKATSPRKSASSPRVSKNPRVHTYLDVFLNSFSNNSRGRYTVNVVGSWSQVRTFLLTCGPGDGSKFASTPKEADTIILLFGYNIYNVYRAYSGGNNLPSDLNDHGNQQELMVITQNLGTDPAVFLSGNGMQNFVRETVDRFKREMNILDNYLEKEKNGGIRDETLMYEEVLKFMGAASSLKKAKVRPWFLEKGEWVKRKDANDREVTVLVWSPVAISTKKSLKGDRTPQGKALDLIETYSELISKGVQDPRPYIRVTNYPDRVAVVNNESGKTSENSSLVLLPPIDYPGFPAYDGSIRSGKLENAIRFVHDLVGHDRYAADIENRFRAAQHTKVERQITVTNPRSTNIGTEASQQIYQSSYFAPPSSSAFAAPSSSFTGMTGATGGVTTGGGATTTGTIPSLSAMTLSELGQAGGPQSRSTSPTRTNLPSLFPSAFPTTS